MVHPSWWTPFWRLAMLTCRFDNLHAVQNKLLVKLRKRSQQHVQCNIPTTYISLCVPYTGHCWYSSTIVAPRQRWPRANFKQKDNTETTEQKPQHRPYQWDVGVLRPRHWSDGIGTRLRRSQKHQDYSPGPYSPPCLVLCFHCYKLTAWSRSVAPPHVKPGQSTE